MVGLIRTILILIVLMACWGIIEKRFHVQKKWPRIIAMMVILCVVVLACFFPPEALLLSFDTPEAAYNYSYGGSVVLTLDGDNSALVVAEDGEAGFNHEIVPRRNDNWGMCSGFGTEAIYGLNQDATIAVYRHRKSNDAYICISSTMLCEISDNRASAFQVIPVSDSLYQGYYAYIGTWSEDYRVTINGTTYQIVSGLAQPAQATAS